MSLQLNLDEMLEALGDIDHPEFADILKGVENLANRAAVLLAEHFDCLTDTATFDGVAFAGTCAPFRPKFAGQDCPEGLSQFDDGGADDWESDLEQLEGATA